MSTDQPSGAAPAVVSTRKLRSPLEKFLVRGGIAFLLLLVAVQAHARLGYERSLSKLQSRLATEDASETFSPLLVSEMPQYIVGWPSRSLMEDRHWKLVVYKWYGLTKTFEIRMQYDGSEAQPAIMGLETADPPEEQVPEITPEMIAAAQSMPTPAPPMMGPGGPRQDPIARDDKDGDGKVSKDEATQRLAENFANIDTNTDGYVDAEELAAMRQRFAAAGGGGRGGPPGSGPPDRPRRPASESTDAPSTSEASPSETPAADPTADTDTPVDATTPGNQ